MCRLRLELGSFESETAELILFLCSFMDFLTSDLLNKSQLFKMDVR